MVNWILAWKAFRFFVYFATALQIVLFPLVDSVTIGVKEGDWKPLGKATGGLIFAADEQIKTDIELLTNATIREKFPEKFDVKFVSSVKSDILTNVAIIVVMGLIIFILLMKVAGNAAEHLGMQIMLGLLTVVILALLEFAWLAGFEGIVQIPFEGLWNLITNYQFILETGVDIPLVANPDALVNITTEITDTINSTINTTL